MAQADRAPKKIAGLKLPKSVRQMPAIRALLTSEAGRELLEEALLAGAEAAARHIGEAIAVAKAAGRPVLDLESAGTAEVAAGQPLEEVEQIAEQFEEPDVSRKRAPNAAPVDDVVPTAVEELIPTNEEMEPAADTLADEFGDEDRVKPGAAD